MTAALGLALLLQAVGIILLRCRLGYAWLRRPATLLYLASVAYEGVSPLLLTASSVRAWDTFRQDIAPQYTDEATLLGSAGMLALVICYLLTQPQCVTAPAQDRAALARALDWRLLAAASAPLAVLTWEGRGYGGIVGLDSPGATLATQLAATLFAILTAVTAFAFLMRHGTRWFVPVLAAQSFALAAAGERGPVLIDAIALGLMLCHAGARPSRRSITAAIALTAVAVMAVTGVRAEHGRSLQYADSGLSARAAALAAAVTSPPPAQAGPGLAAQAASRFDGTAFAGGILQAQAMGQPRLSATYVPASLLVLVPSALWPSKLRHGAAFGTWQAEIAGFGLQDTNFLPTLPGLYTGFLAWPWLIALMGFLGLAAGWGERWLLREATPARLVMLAGAVTSALYYEQGLPGMLAALRSAAIIAVAVKAVEMARVQAPHVDSKVGTPASQRQRVQARN